MQPASLSPRVRAGGLLAAACLVLALAWWLVFHFVPLRPGVTGALAATAPSRPDAGAGWPMFGHSAARTRFVPSLLRPPFRLRYTIPGRSLIEMPPVVSQGLIVFGTHDGLVVASRAKDGSRAWETTLGGCIASSPAVWRHLVIVGWASPAPCGRNKGETGGIVALDLTTGKVAWRFRSENVESSPAVIGNVVFFSAYRDRANSTVYALAVGERRRVLWKRSLPTKIASSPALAGGTVYITAYDRRIYAFEASTGRLRWQASAFSDEPEVRLLLGVRSLVTRNSWSEGGFYATPALAYRRVYAGVIDGVFSAFDARTGVHRWSRSLDGSIYGSAAIWKNRVYVGTTSGRFYALAADDGRVLWTAELGGKILGSPTVTSERVYVASTARETVVLDAKSGGLRWRFGDGYYSPLVVAGERAFLVGKGRVYALEKAPGWRTRWPPGVL
jgi:outer membrane protein assembly factor BamB